MFPWREVDCGCEQWMYFSVDAFPLWNDGFELHPQASAWVPKLWAAGQSEELANRG